jgi:protein-disulfide isomerase
MKRVLEVGGTLAVGILAATVMTEAVRSQWLFQQTESGGAPPEFVPGWEQALSVATRLEGTPAAPVHVVSLADLECPACRRFHDIAKDVVGKRPSEAQFLHVHYPLGYHEYARSAALGAECALAAEGLDGFRRWLDAVYADQESLGQDTWREYGDRAGLEDPDGLAECIASATDTARIAAGLAFGRAFPVEFTPTVIIEGWHFQRSPNAEELRAAIDAILAGRTPAAQQPVNLSRWRP